MKNSIFFLFATGLIAGFSSAENWSEFRGPDGQGHAPDADVPLEWNAEKNVKWKVPVAGKAWSSPIVIGSRIFVTTAVEENSGLTLHVIALQLETGEEIWNKTVFTKQEAGKQHKKNSHASPTPIYEDGKIYAHFGHHGTACVDAKSGEVIWAVDEIYSNPVHGTGGSPAIVGDKLIFSCDPAKNPFVIALNKANGKEIWKTPRDVKVSRPFSFSTPLAIEVGGKTQVISPGSGAVIAYDPDSGKEIWRCRYGEGYSVVPRPPFTHGLVIVCSGFNKANMLAVDPTGTGDVTDSHLKWEITKTIPKESSPIVVGDLLFVNDDKGVLSCVDVESGEVHFQERLDGRGGYSASPVYASGHLFFHNGDGTTTVVKPGDEFEKVAENSIGEYGLSSFGVTKDGFLIRTESSLIRVAK